MHTIKRTNKIQNAYNWIEADKDGWKERFNLSIALDDQTNLTFQTMVLLVLSQNQENYSKSNKIIWKWKFVRSSKSTIALSVDRLYYLN